MWWLAFCFQVLGTDELNAYLNKYRLELDPHLEALVGRLVSVAVAGVGRKDAWGSSQASLGMIVFG